VSSRGDERVSRAPPKEGGKARQASPREASATADMPWSPNHPVLHLLPPASNRGGPRWDRSGPAERTEHRRKWPLNRGWGSPRGCSDSERGGENPGGSRGGRTDLTNPPQAKQPGAVAESGAAPSPRERRSEIYRSGDPSFFEGGARAAKDGRVVRVGS